MSVPTSKIIDGALLRRGTRYRLVTEVWSAKTNEKMRAARGELLRVGLFPSASDRDKVRVQYLPVNADGVPLETGPKGQPLGWRWADLSTVASWAKEVL